MGLHPVLETLHPTQFQASFPPNTQHLSNPAIGLELRHSCWINIYGCEYTAFVGIVKSWLAVHEPLLSFTGWGRIRFFSCTSMTMENCPRAQVRTQTRYSTCLVKFVFKPLFISFSFPPRWRNALQKDSEALAPAQHHRGDGSCTGS